ncbi:hypothetical protein KM92DES2_12490 [uncultured Desulfovibrio sp.]|uniref:Uncharacterized protein n=1 Tax=uncultured Desulfovibrio sp. TaxID=167968 RepID=A0A212K9W1_9BACT|nr:hypothetical protein KM92DES2_12490 [uncultured Desulfovibrio sp.]
MPAAHECVYRQVAIRQHPVLLRGQAAHRRLFKIKDREGLHECNKLLEQVQCVGHYP